MYQLTQEQTYAAMHAELDEGEDIIVTAKYLTFEKLNADMGQFQRMYGLPNPGHVTVVNDRVESFLKILREELDEGDDLVEQYNDVTVSAADYLTGVADWLGDIIVYCLSEMRRYGFDPAVVLPIIMASNFTKLDAEGNPIIRPEDGKVMKGPNFKAPEPTLLAVIKKSLKCQTPN